MGGYALPGALYLRLDTNAPSRSERGRLSDRMLLRTSSRRSFRSQRIPAVFCNRRASQHSARRGVKNVSACSATARSVWREHAPATSILVLARARRRFHNHCSTSWPRAGACSFPLAIARSRSLVLLPGSERAVIEAASRRSAPVRFVPAAWLSTAECLTQRGRSDATVHRRRSRAACRACRDFWLVLLYSCRRRARLGALQGCGCATDADETAFPVEVGGGWRIQEVKLRFGRRCWRPADGPSKARGRGSVEEVAVGSEHWLDRP